MKHLMKTFIGFFLFTFAFSFSGTAQEDSEAAAIDGYCPVAYKMMEKAVKGKPDYAVQHEGKTYYLLKDKAKKAFKKNPDKFLPEYGGYCATAVSQGKKVEAKGELFVLHQGKTYLFSNERARKMFKKHPEEVIKMANERYAELKE